MFKLGHVHLKVRDLNRAVEFYSRVFGLRVTEKLAGQYAFLTGGEQHHDVALQQLGERAAQPSPLATGLYHVAFEVEDRETLARTYFRLKHEGIDVAAVDHGISWALYFEDRDGNGLEIYWDARHAKGGRSRWRGQSVRLPEDVLKKIAEGTALAA